MEKPQIATLLQDAARTAVAKFPTAGPEDGQEPSLRLGNLFLQEVNQLMSGKPDSEWDGVPDALQDYVDYDFEGETLFALSISAGSPSSGWNNLAEKLLSGEQKEE